MSDFDAPQKLRIRKGGEDFLSIDVSHRLRTGELISGTPTVVPDAASGVTVSDISVVNGNSIQAKFDATGNDVVPRSWPPYHVAVEFGVSGGPGTIGRPVCVALVVLGEC